MTIADDKYDPLWRKELDKRNKGVKCIHCNSEVTTRAHLIGRNNRRVRYILENGVHACNPFHRMLEEGEKRKIKYLDLYIEDGKELYNNLLKISRGTKTAKELGYTDVRNL
jgi:hypothetical protein